MAEASGIPRELVSSNVWLSGSSSYASSDIGNTPPEWMGLSMNLE
jgi:hypothetical protein